MTAHEAIKELDEMTDADHEGNHVRADQILLARLKQLGEHALIEAWECASERVRFWYS